MKYSRATVGRIFILRLENGETLHEQIEAFAKLLNIKAAKIELVGGVDAGSKLVVGPEDRLAEPIIPMEVTLDDAYEVTGFGTLFLNEIGDPITHIHLACGRGKTVLAGCARRGMKVWLVLEVVITELTGTTAYRKKDSNGFELLDMLS